MSTEKNRVVDLSHWGPRVTPTALPIGGMECRSRADVNYRCVMPAVENSVRDMAGGSAAGKNPFLSHLEAVMETHADGKAASDESKRFKIGKFVILGYGSRDYVTTVIQWLKGLSYTDEDIKRILIVFDFSPASAADLLLNVATKAVFEYQDDNKRNIFVFDVDSNAEMVRSVDATGYTVALTKENTESVVDKIRNEEGLCIAHIVGHAWPMIYRPEQVDSALTFFSSGGFDILGIDISESWDGIIRKLDAGDEQVFQPWVSMAANADTLTYKSPSSSATEPFRNGNISCQFKQGWNKNGKTYCPNICDGGENDNVILGMLTRKNGHVPCFVERGYGYRWTSKGGDAPTNEDEAFAFAQKHHERMISSGDIINELRMHKCYLTEKLVAPTYFGAMSIFIFAPHPSAHKNLSVFSNVFADAVCEEIIKPMLGMLKGHPLFRGLSQIIFYAVLPFGKDATYAKLLKACEKVCDLSSVEDWALLNEFSMTQHDFANAEYTKDSLLGDPARVFFSDSKQDKLNACDFQMDEHERTYSEEWRKRCFPDDMVDIVPKGGKMFISAVPLYSGSFPFAVIGFAVPNAVFGSVPSSSTDGDAARRAVMTEGFRALMSKSGWMKSFLLKVFNNYLAERDSSGDLDDSNRNIRAECDAYLRNVRNKDWHLADFGFGTTSLIKGKTVQNEDQSMDGLWDEALTEAMADPLTFCFIKLSGFFASIGGDGDKGHARASKIHAERAAKILSSYECSNKIVEGNVDAWKIHGLAGFVYDNDRLLDPLVNWIFKMLKSIQVEHPHTCLTYNNCLRQQNPVKPCATNQEKESDINYLKLKGMLCAGNPADGRDGIRFSLWRILGAIDAYGNKPVNKSNYPSFLDATNSRQVGYSLSGEAVHCWTMKNDHSRALVELLSYLLPRLNLDDIPKMKLIFNGINTVEYRLVISGTVTNTRTGEFWKSLCSWVKNHATLLDDSKLDMLHTSKARVVCEICFTTLVQTKKSTGEIIPKNPNPETGSRGELIQGGESVWIKDEQGHFFTIKTTPRSM